MSLQDNLGYIMTSQNQSSRARMSYKKSNSIFLHKILQAFRISHWFYVLRNEVTWPIFKIFVV